MVASITHPAVNDVCRAIVHNLHSTKWAGGEIAALATMRFFQIAKFTLLPAALASAIGCAAGEGPTSPSGANPGSSSQNAAVAVDSIVAQREFMGGDTDAYYVSFSLREVTGKAGATVKAMDLTFGNGTTATFGPERLPDAHIGPGEAVSVSELSATGSVNSRTGSVQIRILLTDDRGQDSTSGAAAAITSTYVLSGRITNKDNGRPIAGAKVTVTFGGASGRGATSDSTGAYALRRVPAGPVSFTVSAPGFTTITRTATMDGNVAVDVAL
jgi:carboxypeptidase family protein